MASSVFPTITTGVTVQTATSGALSGDGSSGNKLAVEVDGATIDVNGSNQLEVIGGGGGIGGSISDGQVAVGSGVDTIAGTTNFQYGTAAGGDGTTSLSLGPAPSREFLSTGVPLSILNQDDDTAFSEIVLASYVDSGSKYAFSDISYSLSNPAYLAGQVVGLFNVGAEGTLANDGTVTDWDFYIFDNKAPGNLLVISTAGGAVFSGIIKAAGYKSSDGSAGVTVAACTGFKNGLCISGT